MARNPKVKLHPTEVIRLIALAKTCTSRQEFKEMYPLAWKLGRTHRYHTEMFRHMKRISPARVWTFDKIVLESKKYKFRNDFKHGSPGAYNAAIKKGILNVVCLHMSFKTKIVWDNSYKNKLIKEISKCTTYAEFNLKYQYQVSMIKKLGWSEILKPLIKSKRAYTSIGESTIILFFNRLFNVKFNKSYPKWLINPNTGYQLELDGFCKKINIAIEHNGQHHKAKDIQFKDRLKKDLCVKNGVKLLVFPDITIFHKKENELLLLIKNKLKELGIPIPSHFNKVKIKWVFPDNTKAKYNLEDLINEAKKHSSLKEFRMKSPKHCDSAYKRGVMNKILEFLPKEKIKLSDEDLVAIAKKYNKLSEFRLNKPREWENLRARRLLFKQATSHMSRFKRD